MTPDNILTRLEKVFTEPLLGRVLFALVVIGSLVYLNHESGFIHHYDTQSQLDELAQLRSLSEEDSSTAVQLDSLRRSVLEEMQQHQEPLRSKLPLGTIEWVAASIIPIWLFLMGSLIPTLTGQYTEKLEAAGALIGGLLGTSALWGLGVWATSTSVGLAWIVALPILTQSLIILITASVFAVLLASPEAPTLEEEPTKAEIEDYLRSQLIEDEDDEGEDVTEESQQSE